MAKSQKQSKNQKPKISFIIFTQTARLLQVEIVNFSNSRSKQKSSSFVKHNITHFPALL